MRKIHVQLLKKITSSYTGRIQLLNNRVKAIVNCSDSENIDRPTQTVQRDQSER